MLGIVAGNGLSGFGRWDVSRRMLLAEGRIYPAQKHKEKAGESLRRLQALALPLLIKERDGPDGFSQRRSLRGLP